MNVGSSNGVANHHHHSGGGTGFVGSGNSMNDRCNGCLPCIVSTTTTAEPPNTLSSSVMSVNMSNNNDWNTATTSSASTRKKKHNKNYYHPDDVTSTLAKELAQVSVKERNDAYDEIHCITANANEDGTNKRENDSEFINKCIEQMKLNISRTRPREAYNKACFLAPTKYRDNNKFYLLFLRATDYDPSVSASMLVTYFEYKAKLFGTDKVRA